MQLGYSNRHHGVPRSFLGSSEQSNLSLVDAEEHGLFHAMAGHLPPDYLTRRSMLSSVDWTDRYGKMLPAEVFEDVLNELTPSDWGSMYQPGAIRSGFQHEWEEKDFAKGAIHVQMQICREQYDVADALNSTLRRQHLSPRRVYFRNAISNFFHEENPTDVLRKYLLDVSDHDVKWIKPLSMSVRSRLLTALKDGKPEKPSVRRSRDMEDIMVEHRRRLASCMHSWEPRVTTFETFIASHTETVPMFRDYLQFRERQAS